MMQNTSTDDITKLNSLQRITPEVARLLMKQHRSTDRLTLELDGLQSIDDESLAILINGHHDVTLNGIRTLSLSQVNVLANRDSNTIISLSGLQEIDAVVWGSLAPLKHIYFPFWLKQQPEYVEHHFNRKPTGPYNINFSGVSTELFKEIDFSQVERLNLGTLDVFTPTHVNHLSTFAFTHIDIPAHLLTRRYHYSESMRGPIETPFWTSKSKTLLLTTSRDWKVCLSTLFYWGISRQKPRLGMDFCRNHPQH